jgi:diadenosine tetraphosphate (Ap4A) HIT family hydrolase
MTMEFALDPRLDAGTTLVKTLGLSELRLMNDARFPWLLLVPRRGGVREIIDLAEGDRQTLLEEIALASQALKATTGCHNLNVAALGNVVPQLHVHVIGRFPDDPAWPRPVWGVGEAVAYDVSARDKLTHRLIAALPA